MLDERALLVLALEHGRHVARLVLDAMQRRVAAMQRMQRGETLRRLCRNGEAVPVPIRGWWG